jgi:hypothetical protein
MNKTPVAGGCYVAVAPLTPLQRLWRRLYPSRHLQIPEDLEGFAPSYMLTLVMIRLDWADRLRILVSGNLRVETHTKTDVAISKMDSQSMVTVLPPGRFRDRI